MSTSRPFSKIGSTLWTGATGRAIKRKGGAEGLLVAAYLISAPGSNMLGLYYQPLLYIAEETGLGIEGASKGLRGCIEAGFCRYDDDSKMVWIVEMAKWQIGDELKSGDKRCIGVQRAYDALPDNPFLGAFFERYGKDFKMTEARSEHEAPYQAPPKPLTKPLRSQEQEQEIEQEKETTPSPPCRRGDVGFEAFWAEWPRHKRKAARKQCLAKWRANGCEAIAERVLAALRVMKASDDWRKDDGQFIPAPLVWLGQERWEAVQGAVAAMVPAWVTAAGFGNRDEAEAAGCTARNAAQFRDGERLLIVPAELVRNGSAASLAGAEAA